MWGYREVVPVDPFSETGRWITFWIIWGFSSVTVFEVPPGSFVSGSCPLSMVISEVCRLRKFS
ncbi:hypothetical protein DPMN_048920 [Dreissena polymorpha]|uniref:Uncharacterized protein n=1 Tax=Dreissena polymorpha TaxID=45954 RepID=A0A9D4DAV4_DREPO|nr:hypothetical protein DPMN_048920 [Dreissena polymorpha]